MANETPRFRLTTFDRSDDALSYRGYKFTDADRVLIDRLLRQAAEHHRHVGGVDGGTEAPPAAPNLTSSTTGGAIPSDTAVYYRYAIVEPSGQEHVGSQAAVVYTTPAVPAPAAPSIAPTAGALLGGDYTYVVSAYTAETSRETTVSDPASGRLAAAGGFIVGMPPLPSGATGFNLYRKGPTDRDPIFVATVTDATFADNGTAVRGLRSTPSANTTSSTNAVAVNVTLPTGSTCRVYRTFSPLSWDDSLLTWTAVMPAHDTGHATQPGAPLSASAAVHSPPKVTLGTDVEGSLPPPLNTVTRLANFSIIGPIPEGPSLFHWINEYDLIRLRSMRATLGPNSPPADHDMHIGLEFTGDTTTSGGSLYRETVVDAGTGDPVTSTILTGGRIGSLVSLVDIRPSGNFNFQSDLRLVVIPEREGIPLTERDLNLDVRFWAIGATE